jgi:flagellar hook assembly protein FlgD
LYIFDNNTKRIQVVSQSGRDSEEMIVLDKNRPNPVDNFTEISFTLSEPLYLTITIYNLIGEPVKQIVKDRYLKGSHRVVWKAVDEKGNLVPNGVYFYRLESNKGVAIRQLIVLR